MTPTAAPRRWVLSSATIDLSKHNVKQNRCTVGSTGHMRRVPALGKARNSTLHAAEGLIGRFWVKLGHPDIPSAEPERPTDRPRQHSTVNPDRSTLHMTIPQPRRGLVAPLSRTRPKSTSARGGTGRSGEDQAPLPGRGDPGTGALEFELGPPAG